jgi:hypothetical protein
VRNASAQISLLLPTRERPALVHRLFDSLIRTTADLGTLQVVLYVDEDDRASQEICRPELSLVKIVGHPQQTMGKMNQTCYDASQGRYVMLVNDDVVFRSRHWDTRVLEAANRYPDGIMLIYGNDLDQGEAVPTFPIVPRTACQILGGISPLGYRNLHIESHLLDIFKRLARIGHNRICYLDDVIFEHMHYVMGKAAADSVYIKKNQRADDLLFIALDEERAFKAQLLAQRIEADANYHPTDSGMTRRSRHSIKFPQTARLTALLKRMFFWS